jgi:hypothetical protein
MWTDGSKEIAVDDDIRVIEHPADKGKRYVLSYNQIVGSLGVPRITEEFKTKKAAMKAFNDLLKAIRKGDSY